MPTPRTCRGLGNPILNFICQLSSATIEHHPSGDGVALCCNAVGFSSTILIPLLAEFNHFLVEFALAHRVSRILEKVYHKKTSCIRRSICKRLERKGERCFHSAWIISRQQVGSLEALLKVHHALRALCNGELLGEVRVRIVDIPQAHLIGVVIKRGMNSLIYKVNNRRLR